MPVIRFKCQFLSYSDNCLFLPCSNLCSEKGCFGHSNFMLGYWPSNACVHICVLVCILCIQMCTHAYYVNKHHEDIGLVIYVCACVHVNVRAWCVHACVRACVCLSVFCACVHLYICK